MQAVILAAGMGKRLGRLTRNNTKCMLKVHGRTLVERTLDILCAQQIARVVIVVGYEGQNVIDLVGNEWEGVPIHWVWNHDYATTNNIYSLSLTGKYLVEDDTLLLESDLIFESVIIERLLSTPHPNLAVVSRYESWMDGTVVCLDEEDNIVRFVPKKHFSYDDIGQYFKTVNIYKFSRDFLEKSYFPFLQAYSSAMGNNEYYEQVLRIVLSLERQDLQAMRLTGEKWYEIDDVQDLDNAEAVFAPDHERLKAFSSRWGGYWRFPGLQDFCFLVNPYFPTPVMVEEMKAYFHDLLVEYPSGQRVQRLLASKMFGCLPEQILVGNGAAELISALMQDLDGKVGVVVPTFDEYANRVGFSDCAQLVPLSLDRDFRYSVDQILSFVEKAGLRSFILINPDNPTGHYLPKFQVLRLAKTLGEKCIRLILDESFLDFSHENAAGTFLGDADLEQCENLVVIKSISKSYGVPGARLGVVASGDKDLMQRLEKRISIWNINSFGEFFLQIVGKYEKSYAEASRRIREERRWFGNELERFAFLRVIPSQSNYFTCEVLPPYTATGLCELLLNRHQVLLKDCTGKPGFLGGQYVRIAVRDRNDNANLLQILGAL